MKRFFALTTVSILLCMVSTGNATPVLVSDSGGTYDFGYSYYKWSNFNSALDNVANVTITPSFEDYNQMLQYDAILLDQRWIGGTLSSTEIANISSFIATGARVLMMGENNLWEDWNNQILNIVGGSFAGEPSGVSSANTIVGNELTESVSSIFLPTVGMANGGTALFDYNVATLWGDSVLTVLDVNIWADSYWDREDNAQFANNIVNWLASSESPAEPVPEPATLLLFGAGIIGLAGAKIGKKKLFSEQLK